MTYWAEIIDGTVSNVSYGDEGPQGWIRSDTKVGKGWTYVNQTFSEPAKPAPPAEEDAPPISTEGVQFIATQLGVTPEQVRAAFGL